MNCIRDMVLKKYYISFFFVVALLATVHVHYNFYAYNRLSYTFLKIKSPSPLLTY